MADLPRFSCGWEVGKRVKREVVRLFVGKSHNKGVIRCDPYDKLDEPFFEKYVREQFPKLFGKANKNVV